MLPSNTTANRGTIQRTLAVHADGTTVAATARPAGAPTTVATASGDNLAQSPVTVGTSSTIVALGNAVARIVSFFLDPAATGNVTLSFNTPAVFGRGVYTLTPGQVYETPVPVATAIYAIGNSGTQTITRVEFL